MLTSRVLLHIRSHAEDNLVWPGGLMELDTNHPRGDDEIKISTTKKSPLA